jgi:transcriptional regulator with XRE-family HTH domain
MIIAERLKEFREKHKISQVELSRLLGVSSSSLVSVWERGIKEPRNADQLRLALLALEEEMSGAKNKEPDRFWSLVKRGMEIEIKGR